MTDENLPIVAQPDEGTDDEQLRALHAAAAALALPVDVHVIGVPLVLVAVDYTGNPRRGLVARCRDNNDQEHLVAFPDVAMREGTPEARYHDVYSAWLGVPPRRASATRRRHKAGDADLDLSKPVDLVVRAVTQRAARCTLLGTERTITLRAKSLHRVVPGQIVTVQPGKQWKHSGHPYLSGDIVANRIDASALGLIPLAVRRVDGTTFEMETPEIDLDGLGPITDDDEAAEKLLETDLRYLDVHTHLGDRLMRMSPQWALLHYEVGVRIGELSIGPDFDGALPWSAPGNRPILRALLGLGTCLWRLERWEEAEGALVQLIRLDPTDQQAARVRLQSVRDRVAQQ